MANDRQAGILGTGSYLPDKVLTNFDLEKMVETSDEWIVTRTGIRERRIAEPGTGAAALGVKAARKALASGDVDPAEVDMILVATMSSDYQFPATACVVQEQLGAKKAAACDIGAACSGFLYALPMGAQFVASGKYSRVLVIATEMMSAFVDWSDRATCVLFGDGAGAVVLGPAEGRRRIESYGLYADGAGVEKLYQPAGGSRMPASKETVEGHRHFLKLRGQEVFKFAVVTLAKTVKAAAESVGVKPEEFSLVIPHQMNHRIIKAVSQRCGVPMDKMYMNIERYGNTSAATIPIALDEALAEGRLKEGDLVLLVALGAGFTWAHVVIRW